MNCKNCGAPLKVGAKFCAGCGQTIKETTPASPAQNYSQPVQQNYGSGYAQNQPNYGSGYAQNQQNYGYQGQQGGYGGYSQQGGYGGYSVSPAANGSSSAIKTIMILIMAAAMIFSSLGLLFFPFVRSTDDYVGYSTNGTVLCGFINSLEAHDGDLGETLEIMFDDDDEVLASIGFIASVVLLAVSVIFYIIGLVFGLVGSHSGAAAIMGIGSLITAVGYLLVSIEGISFAAEVDDMAVSFAPILMLIVSVIMFVLACVSAGKLREA